ncbi:unnamed protein product [Auanema sp. JU1783]|nr:unnamed protein product [Auanema sp. JU1783]
MIGSDGLQLDFQEQCMIGDQLKVELMLRTGFVDVHFQHKMSGWTALHWASKRAHENVCVILLGSGFDRDTKDNQGRTPYDVCPLNCTTLREILRPDCVEAEMPEASSSRASSSENDNAFVPSYIRNPIFPYTGKPNSFDAVTPNSPTGKQSYYSYGRRDSLNKTRFLLLRTSFGNGKETYKRITLPGGSTVEQLRKLIEKATQRPVSFVITLPDKVLIEEDEQIQEFGDSQKIEVIYDDESSDSSQSAEIESAEKKKMEENFDSSLVNNSLTSEIPNDTSLIDIPQDDEEQPTTDVPAPPIDSLNTVSAEATHEAAPTSSELTEVLSAEEDSELPVDITDERIRASMDSDPGDYVKIEHDESSKKQEISTSKEETLPTVADDESPRAVILEKSKLDETGGITKWVDENPEAVRRAATIAAIASAAGIGYLIYARKFK